jgi:hypothetical protein
VQLKETTRTKASKLHYYLVLVESYHTERRPHRRVIPGWEKGEGKR